MNYFQEKTAVVTGGTSGIGKAVAQYFAKQGAQVAVLGRNEQRGQAAVDEITSEGGTAHFFRVDVTQPDQIKEALTGIASRFGQVNFLYNGAGVVNEAKPLSELEDEAILNNIFANLSGAVLMVKYALPYLRQNGGVIVNTSSVAALGGQEGYGPYAAAKGGIISLTKQLAVEEAKNGIRVVTVTPGPIDTPLLADVVGDDQDQAQQAMKMMVPLQRAGQPQEIANMVVWLCSDEASYVTGQNFVVDGGMSAK